MRAWVKIGLSVILPNGACHGLVASLAFSSIHHVGPGVHLVPKKTTTHPVGMNKNMAEKRNEMLVKLHGL